MSQVLRISRLFLLLLPLTLAGAVAPWSEGTAAAASPCETAATLADTGRLGAAEEKYAKALEDKETEACAAAGLRQLDEAKSPPLDKATSPCATAEALEKAGRDTQAQAAYEKVLESRPGSECAKKGVKAPEEHFWDDPSGAADDLLAWLGLIAVGLGLGGAIVALLLVPMTRIPGLRRLPPASRIRAVRLGIDSFEDNSDPSQGPTLAALARTKMESAGEGNSHMRMVDSRAAAEETIWSKLGAINDQTKGVSVAIEAISVLYPRRRFEATGVLQTDSGRGPGLSLSVRKKQSIVGATTLWAQTFGLEPGEGDSGKVDRLQKLAVPAAAWISHVSLTGAGETPGGSKDPISWALFKAGKEWELDGNNEKATALYKAAIELDPNTWGAFAQLGKLASDKREYAEAERLLRKALDLLENNSTAIKTPSPGKNPDWYRIKYRLASTLANKAYDKGCDYAEAERELDELLEKCWPMLKPSPLDLLLKKDHAVREFVAGTVQYAALNVKALIELERDGRRMGENEAIGLRAVRRRLRKGVHVPPLTIVEEVLRNKKNKSHLLLLDIACFFNLGGDKRRANYYAKEALDRAPESRREAVRAAAAEDPMLRGLSALEPKDKPRCQWSKREPEKAKTPPRSWF